MKSTPPPQWRKRSFDRLARLYDLGVKLLCLPFGGEGRLRREFMKFIRIRRGEVLLDACCGTGTLIALISKNFKSEVFMVGVDFSLNMIRVARRKVRDFNASLILGSAEAVPLRGGVLDKLLCSFGLHEMDKRGRLSFLVEARRVLRGGGRLYVLDYSHPKTLLSNLVLKAAVKAIEENTAYETVFNENLASEAVRMGFRVERRREIFFKLFQVIEFSFKAKSI